jgi:hypothetical protein
MGHQGTRGVTLAAATVVALGVLTTADVALATRPVSLAVRSRPAGITVLVGERKVRAPWQTVVTSGTPTLLQAPLTARSRKGRLRFVGWSDGAPARHILVVPPTDALVTAIYRLDRRPPGAPVAAPAVADAQVADVPPPASPVAQPVSASEAGDDALVGALDPPPAARWLLGDTSMLLLRAPVGI